MLMTQKFHSANDIDAEFIPSLEALLCECIPSFRWIKNYEENSPKDTHFAYYLFFGSQHNSPIGFAQIALESKKSKSENSEKGFFKNIFSKSKPESKTKTANWIMPGSLNEGVVIEPRYIKDATLETKSLFLEYLAREDVDVQSLCFSNALSEIKNIQGPCNILTNEKIVPNLLVKNQSHYEGYLSSLDKNFSQEVKMMWRQFYKDEMKLGEYQSFKEVFSYRKNSIETYKKYKSDPLVKKYQEEDCLYLTVEKNNEVLAVIFFIKGHGHHYFFDFIKIDSEVSDLTLNQIIIMKFYETREANRLHLLKKSDHILNYQAQGFTTRSQIFLSAS